MLKKPTKSKGKVASASKQKQKLEPNKVSDVKVKADKTTLKKTKINQKVIDKNLSPKQEQEANVLPDALPLEILNFSKKYKGNKKNAVDNASFKVKKGEFHGFIGANGAGKTTTIKSLVGAYAKFKGKVTIFGHSSTDVQAKKYIGYIPEKANFPKELTSYQYIWRMARLSGYDVKSAKRFAKEHLQKIGMSEFANKNPNKLSSGQKKKILLAQALAHNPSLIIMDEPAANLDPKARADFFSTLKVFQKEGKTIFMSSHILAELGNFVDALTILDEGKVLFNGDIKELQSNSDLKYQVIFENVQDQAKFKTFLKAKKIKSWATEDGVIAAFKSMPIVHQALKFINDKKLSLLNFNTEILSLEKIYEKFTKNSSIEHLKGGKNV